MKRILSASLLLAVYLFNPIATLAATQSTESAKTEEASKSQDVAPEETQTTEKAQTEETLPPQRTFPSVEPEKIPLEATAVIVSKQETGDEVKRKVLAEYTPIQLTIHNQSGKLLKIPNNSIFLIDRDGDKKRVPTETEIFQEIKRNGIGRALLWGVPLGAVSFGLLAIPAVVYSGVHTKVMNNGVKDNLSAQAFHGGTISPDGTFTTYLFIPRRQASKMKKVVLSQVINIEDEIETQYTADINELETSKK